MSLPHCPRCNRSLSDGPQFRTNPKSEVGIFVCMGCLTPEERATLDPDAVELATIISKTSYRPTPVDSGFDIPHGEVPPTPLF